MINAETIITSSAARVELLLGFSPEEHPIALQLGGSDPVALAAATRIAVRDFGYDAINLNCGCPSDAVAGRGAGAGLLLDAHRAAQCCAAISGAAGRTPLTVKCRTGISIASEWPAGPAAAAAAAAHGGGPWDSAAGLEAWARRVVDDGGARRLTVHARAGILGATSMENRCVPPLRPELAAALAAALPGVPVSANGGITSPADAAALLRRFPALSGAMAGRAVINHPWAWAMTDPVLFGCPEPPATAATRGTLLAAYIAYADRQTAARAAAAARGAAVTAKAEWDWALAAPAFNLLAGDPHAAVWRRRLHAMLPRGVPAGSALAGLAAAAPPEALATRPHDPPPPQEALTPHARARASSGPLRSFIT